MSRAAISTLEQIAYARSGDKGRNANIGVIAHNEAGYAWLQAHLTAQRVKEYFAHTPVDRVERFELPNLHALNFLLYGVLGKGGSQTLAIDTQGKALGQVLLQMQVDITSEEIESFRA